MDYGVVMFPTEYAIAPDELARALEERGFESLWFPEHTHIPASRRSPWPGGGRPAQEYWHTLRPVRRADGGGGGDQTPEARHGHLPRVERDPISPPRRSPRLDQLVGRPLALRHRRRLERRGDGEPRDAPSRRAGGSCASACSR